MYENLAILCAFVFVYSVLSKGLGRTPVNGAIVFALFGLAFGPYGMNLLKLDVTTEGLGILAELTLALVLFTDAANADLGVLKKSFRIPQRLLLIGLPLTILLGITEEARKATRDYWFEVLTEWIDIEETETFRAY